jgi:hypothetical protein
LHDPDQTLLKTYLDQWHAIFKADPGRQKSAGAEVLSMCDLGALPALILPSKWHSDSLYAPSIILHLALRFNSMIPLTSQFAAEPHGLTLYQAGRTGIEVNELGLTFPKDWIFSVTMNWERIFGTRIPT